jgi:hypothetical protein
MPLSDTRVGDSEKSGNNLNSVISHQFVWNEFYIFSSFWSYCLIARAWSNSEVDSESMDLTDNL